jgi:multidrug efflux pump subunit AcrB
MRIIKVALDRPYTFIVVAVLILIISPVMILSTPSDIFPNINIPVIAVSWPRRRFCVFRFASDRFP